MDPSIYNILLSSLESHVTWPYIINKITHYLESKTIGKSDLISAFTQFVSFLKFEQQQNTFSIIVPRTKNWPEEDEWTEFGFSISPVQESFIINKLSWFPTWLTGIEKHNPFSDIFCSDAVNTEKKIPIDKLINEVTGYNNYINAGQAAAVRALLLSDEKNPLLTILPTGTGKSLLFQVSTLLGLRRTE